VNWHEILFFFLPVDVGSILSRYLAAFYVTTGTVFFFF
jgi:hypothetical protein